MNKAMYIVVNKDIKIEKENLVISVGKLVYNYLFLNYILTNPNINDRFVEFKDFYNNPNVVLGYKTEDEILKLEGKGYILIRDKGLTQLKPNTLTCATKGIVNGNIEIVINSDIKIGKGKLAGQIGHCICSYLYHNYIKYINDAAILDKFNNYMIAQKKITLKADLDTISCNLKDDYISTTLNGEVFLVLPGIFDRDLDEVPLWLRDLKLYSK